MKDKFVYFPTAVLGLIVIAIYGYKCVRKEKEFNVATTINILLQSSGVIAGILLISSTFYEDLRARLSGLELYIMIGGIAVFVVSIQGLKRDVFSNSESEK